MADESIRVPYQITRRFKLAAPIPRLPSGQRRNLPWEGPLWFHMEMSYVRTKSENRAVRATTRTYLNSGKVAKWVDETREERWQAWSGRRVLVRALLLYVTLAGVIGLGQFVAMETVKNPSFSLGTCQSLLKSVTDYGARAKVVATCQEAFARQKWDADQATRFNTWVGWLNPLTQPVYQRFFEANAENLRFEQALFNVSAKSDPKPIVKNATCLKPTVEVLTFQENDLKGINAALQQAATQGFFIKESYATKTNGSWVVVFVLEQIGSVPCS